MPKGAGRLKVAKAKKMKNQEEADKPKRGTRRIKKVPTINSGD